MSARKLEWESQFGIDYYESGPVLNLHDFRVATEFEPPTSGDTVHLIRSYERVQTKKYSYAGSQVTLRGEAREYSRGLVTLNDIIDDRNLFSEDARVSYGLNELNLYIAYNPMWNGSPMSRLQKTMPAECAKELEREWVYNAACENRHHDQVTITVRDKWRSVSYLAGVCCLVPSGEGWKIDLLYVDQRYRGRGMGKALVLDALNELKYGTLVSVTTEAGNEASLRVYQSCGFEVDPTSYQHLYYQWFYNEFRSPS